MALEQWKDIAGYEEDYQVSSFGEVRSLKWNKQKILKPGLVKGYKNVVFLKDKVRINHRVHVLVAEAFLGQRPKSLVIDHKDNNQLNNKVENLQYVTIRQNLTKDKKGTSNYPGVSVTKNGRFRGYIKLSGKRSIFLIETKDELKAAEYYKIALSKADEYVENNKTFKNSIKQEYEKQK